VNLHLMSQCDVIDNARSSATKVFQNVLQKDPFKLETDKQAFKREISNAVDGLGRAHILLYYLARGF